MKWFVKDMADSPKILAYIRAYPEILDEIVYPEFRENPPNIEEKSDSEEEPNIENEKIDGLQFAIHFESLYYKNYGYDEYKEERRQKRIELEFHKNQKIANFVDLIEQELSSCNFFQILPPEMGRAEKEFRNYVKNV